MSTFIKIRFLPKSCRSSQLRYNPMTTFRAPHIPPTPRAGLLPPHLFCPPEAIAPIPHPWGVLLTLTVSTYQCHNPQAIRLKRLCSCRWPTLDCLLRRRCQRWRLGWRNIWNVVACRLPTVNCLCIIGNGPRHCDVKQSNDVLRPVMLIRMPRQDLTNVAQSHGRGRGLSSSEGTVDQRRSERHRRNRPVCCIIDHSILYLFLYKAHGPAQRCVHVIRQPTSQV